MFVYCTVMLRDASELPSPTASLDAIFADGGAKPADGGDTAEPDALPGRSEEELMRLMYGGAADDVILPDGDDDEPTFYDVPPV